MKGYPCNRFSTVWFRLIRIYWNRVTLVFTREIHLRFLDKAEVWLFHCTWSSDWWEVRLYEEVRNVFGYGDGKAEWGSSLKRLLAGQKIQKHPKAKEEKFCKNWKKYQVKSCNKHENLFEIGQKMIILSKCRKMYLKIFKGNFKKKPQKIKVLKFCTITKNWKFARFMKNSARNQM